MIRSLVASAAWTPSKYSTNKTTGQTLVLLSAIPTSCTLTDIRSLAYKPPSPLSKLSLSTPRDSSSSSLAASITSIEFQRTVLLNQSGKVLVRFRDANRAIEFEQTANERILGGNKIKAERIDTAPVLPHPLVKRLYEMQRQSPGRVVMIKGLPSHFSQGRLQKVLGRSYALSTETKTYTDEDGKQSQLPPVFEIKDVTGQGENYATNFLVQLQTVTSAMTLVRRWHRSVWHSKEFEKNKFDHEQSNSVLEAVNENEARSEDKIDKLSSQEDEGEADNWRSHLNNDPESTVFGSPGARVLDAYIMY